jgi:DNA invertase Pin-like site-specific DNA recombinase
MRRLASTLDGLHGRRAARWIRESTPGQFDRYGPAAQREMQDGAIARLGLVDTGLTWSVAESGSTVHKSVSMRAMLTAAQAGEFDVLVVGYVARWQRNLRQTLNLLEEVLHPAGVCVWFADEELLSSNDRHWDQLVDEAKAADSWLRKHRRRVTEGLAAKLAAKRDPGGRPPFGFRRSSDKLMEPDPSKLPVVARIFLLSAAGLTDRAVSEDVGIPLFTVRGVLTSPLYLGRLRDGGPANWPSVVDGAVARRSAVSRARRSTNTGRPASPSRPYAISMLHCADCGARLTGDTGYYRHRNPCEPFVEAKPDLPTRRGRTHGKAYRREWYEAVVGEILREVELGSHLLTSVVADVAPVTEGPDHAAIARVAREREAAANRYLRDRDMRALEATMSRLDAEMHDALSERVIDGVPAVEAVRYLRELSSTWEAADGGAGRKMLAEALFNRIDVRGFRDATVRLTDEAIANGFGAVLPEQFAISVSGRGERI